jgi:hypothetical protein
LYWVFNQFTTVTKKVVSDIAVFVRLHRTGVSRFPFGSRGPLANAALWFCTFFSTQVTKSDTQLLWLMAFLTPRASRLGQLAKHSVPLIKGGMPYGLDNPTRATRM